MIVINIIIKQMITKYMNNENTHVMMFTCIGNYMIRFYTIIIIARNAMNKINNKLPKSMAFSGVRSS